MGALSAFDVILKLAARETMAAGYREMTRAHLVIALSRFADTADPAQADPATSTAVCRGFQSLGIETKMFRRHPRRATVASVAGAVALVSIAAPARATAAGAQTPVDVVVVLHNSGSMKKRTAVAAARRGIRICGAPSR